MSQHSIAKERMHNLFGEEDASHFGRNLCKSVLDASDHYLLEECRVAVEGRPLRLW